MRKILLALGGLSAAVALAVLPAPSAAHGGDPHDMMEALAASMAHPMVIAAPSSTVGLGIVHVQEGCHLWTDGKRKAAGVKLVVRPGTRVTIVNTDLDIHKLVRVSGPKIALGPPLKMNGRVTLKLTKRGVYRLMTKKITNPAMPEVETEGEDHVLGLVIVVR